MKIAVLGSGIIGTTTAYKLVEAGLEVVLIDKTPEPANGCSFANGGQLSFGYWSPFASWHLFSLLPLALIRKDYPVNLKLFPGKNFFRWGMNYTAACFSGYRQESQQSMLKLGEYARKCMHEMVESNPFQFNYKCPVDKYYLYGNQFELESDFSAASNVVPVEKVSVEGVGKAHSFIDLSRLSGGFIRHEEGIGNCHDFTVGLFEKLKSMKSFSYHSGEKVTGFGVKNNRVNFVKTEAGEIEVDSVVVALGIDSYELMKAIGIRLPIFPLKGYSVTLDVNPDYPEIPVTDSDHKIVFTRLGNQLRIAGFLDFDGWDTKIKEERIKYMIDYARLLMPEAADYDNIKQKWCGLRPASADGLPIVSKA
ncbi:MAG: FAD-dependent oxidoreductase, partial [Gammaproteobacteria bacterium]|nr:FAD-dependent oxidoreductase [Gammaproteobacteria bacterium]